MNLQIIGLAELFMNNKHLFLNKIQHNHDSHEATLFFRYKGIVNKISVNLIETKTLDGSIIRGINSNEFERFIMNFMNVEDRAKKLDRMHKIIWSYVEGDKALAFPVKIL